jgi:hypothetical protein
MTVSFALVSPISLLILADGVLVSQSTLSVDITPMAGQGILLVVLGAPSFPLSTLGTRCSFFGISDQLLAVDLVKFCWAFSFHITRRSRTRKKASFFIPILADSFDDFIYLDP